MNSELIIHLFSSLQYLEKCVANSKKMLTGQKNVPLSLKINLSQQTRILIQMRRVANTLQLDLAKGSYIDCCRNLQVFYGLHHMIRSEVLNTCQKLTKKKLFGINPSEKLPIINTYSQQTVSFH